MDDKILNTKEMCSFLGVGMTKLQELCRTKPHGFPVAKNGKKYQGSLLLLTEWKNRWYNGEFDI